MWRLPICGYLDDVTLEVDQSALTGESLAVSRGHGESLYSGAVLVRGEADALVCSTGASSYMGKTTELVESAGTVSHFQRAVLRIANYLIVIAVALVTLTVAVSLVRGNPVLQTLEFALVVTIASIPVALPAVLSVTMAVGARQLARQQVSHLPAVEELGGIDLLCSDKTGTLTQNRLAVAARWTARGISDDDLLMVATLASRAEDNDPIDLAVMAAAGQRPAVRVEEFIPFDPVSKHTEALVRDSDGQTFRVSKGAPQVIAALCDGDGAVTQVDGLVAGFAARGHRSLGVARTDGQGSWRLMGVLALADPPRDDSAATITAAKELGIDVKMVTGDQVAIGREIARQVGLGEQILDAAILDTTADDDDSGAQVEATDGFAQVFPEHKYRIVRLLQARGHIVGMTGDGVNDAPALKQADAGIAVAGATDAARAAADVVLLAPGLSVIVDAIGQAREIFARLTSYATYRIAETIRVLLLITLAIVFMNFFHRRDDRVPGAAQRRRHPVHRLRPRARLTQARKVGHARCADHRHRAGRHRCRCDLRAFLPRRQGLWPQPRHDPHHDLPQIVGRRPADHLPHPHPRPLLVTARTRTPAVGRRHHSANNRHPDLRLRGRDDPAGMALGQPRVGLRGVVVPAQ